MAKKDFAIVKNKPKTIAAQAPPAPGPSPEFQARVAVLESQNLREQAANATLRIAKVVAERDATRELVMALQAANEQLTAQIATMKGGKG